MSEEQGSGSSIPGWLIWVLILGGVNLLSWLFEWPFWIY